MLYVAGLQLREFLSLQTICEFAEWNGHDFMQIQNGRLVLSDRCGVFLEIMLLLARRN